FSRQDNPNAVRATAEVGYADVSEQVFHRIEVAGARFFPALELDDFRLVREVRHYPKHPVYFICLQSLAACIRKVAQHYPGVALNLCKDRIDMHVVASARYFYHRGLANDPVVEKFPYGL